MAGFFSTQAKTSNAITSLKIQTSVYGKCRPVTFGRTRVSYNLLWFRNFKQQGSGGKGAKA